MEPNKTVVGENAYLIFFFFGYQKQEISVEGRKLIDVSFKLVLTELDEIIVVGYGVQKKKLVQ